MSKFVKEENILSDGVVRDTLGARISKAREQTGMSLSMAAKLAGIKKETLKSWEVDASEPRINKLSMLAGIFGVSVTYFLADEGHKGELESTAYSKEELLNELQSQFRDIQETQQQLAGMLERVGQAIAKIN